MGCSLSKDEGRPVSLKEYDEVNITLDSFKFERTLGKGGFGKVNACTFQPTQRWFAMKTMKKLTVIEKKGLEMLVSYDFIMPLTSVLYNVYCYYFLMPYHYFRCNHWWTNCYYV